MGEAGKMTITVNLRGQSVEVEAIETEHPELAIHEIKVSNGQEGAPTMGTVWAVSHIQTGEILIYGLLTQELAKMAARMLTATGIKFGSGTHIPYALDLFQAAAQTMTDVYFSTFYNPERGVLAHA